MCLLRLTINQIILFNNKRCIKSEGPEAFGVYISNLYWSNDELPDLAF